MSGLRLYTSNRLEILAGKLAEVLRHPLSSPLSPEIVVVQSRGMERWVSFQLARYLGISANNWFPFPNRFVHEVFSRVVPETDVEASDPFDPAVMTWRIMRILPSCINTPGFEEPGKYLGGKFSAFKRLQLAFRVADTFDQYLLFRPDMIFRWEEGRENNWQAVLWRELVKEAGRRHRAALGRELLELLRGKDPSAGSLTDLPERLSIFGISALPRFYMEVLAGISQYTQVNLFLMNPCREYWGDIVREGVGKESEGGSGMPNVDGEGLYLEEGNSLLASMGKLGRDFFDLVNEFPCEEISCYEEPGKKDLLASIQSHILNLTGSDSENGGKPLFSPEDHSIQIHSCHSPMREMEILHDQLLDYFRNNPERGPSDIVVMTPDIDEYAPYIQAVFDRPADDPRRIPFTVADRSLWQESGLIQAFFEVLDMEKSRFESSRVLDLLEFPCIHRKFGINRSDFELIRKWIRETRIRWGIDEETRTGLGLPAFYENTWRAGLERLLLGYAMPGGNENLFKDILPYDHLEGNEASVLGRFIEFASLLFEKVRSFEKEAALRKWSENLVDLLDIFFSSDEDDEREEQLLREILNELQVLEDSAGFHDPVSVDLVKWYLGRAVDKRRGGSGFIAGGVTFCAMLPMRSIPFPVICLVGMNGDSYPRQQTPLGFDLMAKHPRRGDRSRRHDDRYVFLESILSARERLYISYVGRSIRDNSELPPSVLVNELMDYVERSFTAEKGAVLEQILTEHRLQPFSPDYFREKGRLFSYSRTNCQAARRMLEGREDPAPFISSGLSLPQEEEWKTIDVHDLCRFFSNPAKFLLNRRLGLILDEGEDHLEEKEPFEIQGLDRYSLEQFMVEKNLEGWKKEELFSLTRASGIIPPGTVGQCILEDLSRGVEPFAQKVGEVLKEGPFGPLDLDLDIGSFRLTGRIDGIYPQGLVRYRYARIKPKDRLRIWILHLALNCFGSEGYPGKSMFFGLDPASRKEPVWMSLYCEPLANAKEVLEKILVRYWEGLVRPLQFFPESSWCYIEERDGKGKGEEAALNKADKSWTGNDYLRGEIQDEYFRLCFKDIRPLDREFREIASDIYRPLLHNMISRSVHDTNS